MDIKKMAISLPLTAVLAGAAYAGGYYLDKTYIRQDTYQQAQKDNRVYDLRDKIRDIESNVNRDVRSMYGWEKNEISRLENEIRKLGGTP